MILWLNAGLHWPVAVALKIRNLFILISCRNKVRFAARPVKAAALREIPLPRGTQTLRQLPGFDQICSNDTVFSQILLSLTKEYCKLNSAFRIPKDEILRFTFGCPTDFLEDTHRSLHRWHSALPWLRADHDGQRTDI